MTAIERIGETYERSGDDWAVFDPLHLYRFELGRGNDGSDLRAGRAPGTSLWVMLNPSKAGAEVNDPTIRRVVHFDRRDGFARTVVTNLWPWIATDPRDLDRQLASGEVNYLSFNEHNIKRWLHAGRIVVAWGGHKAAAPRGASLYRRLLAPSGAPVLCLGTTDSGAPKHPLARGWHRVPDDFELVPWEPCR